MALTSAQRQARYRNRRKYDIDAPIEDRLDLMIDGVARTALKQLARHRDTTLRAVLEQLLTDAESDLLDKMNGEERNSYWRRF